MVTVGDMGGCTPEMLNPVEWQVVHEGRHSPEHRAHMRERSDAFQAKMHELFEECARREAAFASLPEAERQRADDALTAWWEWQWRMWSRERAGAWCP